MYVQKKIFLNIIYEKCMSETTSAGKGFLVCVYVLGEIKLMLILILRVKKKEAKTVPCGVPVLHSSVP